MREQGTTDVRFTDIARVMGMTAPALYRYFADRDELLTALIADAYGALGARIAAAREPLPAEDLGGRWVAAAQRLPRVGPQRAAAVRAGPRACRCPATPPPTRAPRPRPPRPRWPSWPAVRRGRASRPARRAADPRGRRQAIADCAKAKHDELEGVVPPETLPGHAAGLGDAARLHQPGGLRPLRLARARGPRRAVPAATSGWPPRPPGCPSRPRPPEVSRAPQGSCAPAAVRGGAPRPG